jgi:hypothetical protein
MKKMRGDTPSRVKINIYTWKCHKKTPCLATFISNKQKYHVFSFIFYLFSSTKSEECRTGPAGGWYQWQRRDGGEKW